MSEWQLIGTEPEGVPVETKIHDDKGARNECRLKRNGRMWWFADGSMYTYYLPTHWRPIEEARSADEVEPEHHSANLTPKAAE